MKIGTTQRLSVEESHIDFEENLSNGTGIDTRPQTNKQTNRHDLYKNRYFYLVRNA
jgi:hypothetical protein